MDKQLCSILIVDDSKNFAEVLTQNLNDLGYNKVSHALSAREALESMNIQSFDILFIDVVMPEVNGIELTTIIRKSNRVVKIVNMSSLAQEKIVLESISAGADDFIQKPMPEHILENVMEKFTNNSEI